MTHDIAIVGPLPPPIGGVSVHLQRLLPYLDEAGLDYFIYNTAGPTEIPGRAMSVADGKRTWFLRHLLRAREPIVLTMNNQWQIWAGSYYWSSWKGKKVVLTFHGEALRWSWQDHSRIVRGAIRRGLESASALVAVNNHIRDFICTIGPFAQKTITVPAFIPPIWRDEDDQAVPEAVTIFCESHHPLLLAIGAPILREGDTDLYGIDMTIELLARLRRTYPGIGVCWFLLDFIGSIPAYAEKMRQEVKRRGLEDQWLFHPPLKAFYPMYKRADLFVRPTVSDGDAVSVREALHFGLPVVASDCAPRLESVALFRTRDMDDYERAVRAALEDLGSRREALEKRPVEHAEDQLVVLLQRLSAEVSRS